MTTIRRSRTVDFSTDRKTTSKSFKIDTEGITISDQLEVKVYIKSNSSQGTYYFKGSDIRGAKSIHFNIGPSEGIDKLKWGTVKPHKMTIKPAQQPIIFFRIAWMKNYKGIKGDKPKGGGSYVDKNGNGGEVYNFSPIRGKYYGYARIQNENDLALEKLGASVRAEYLQGVTVVLFAKKRTGGQFIVGFYKNATLHRNLVSKHDWHYLFSADGKDVQLIDELERNFELTNPRPGMSNVWYVEKHLSKEKLDKVRAYIDNPDSLKMKKGQRLYQPDPEKRKMVEEAAMAMTEEYFMDLGWNVKRVHLDNHGWDIEAINGKEHLLLEVKGLSGSRIHVEFTPNEYSKCIERCDQYKICVVTEALDKAKKKIHIFSSEGGNWVDDAGNELQCEKRTGAIFYV